jgi:hypothetical protein
MRHVTLIRLRLALRYWLHLGYGWRIAWDKARRAS